MKFGEFIKEKILLIFLVLFIIASSEILLLPYPQIVIFVRLYIAICPVIIIGIDIVVEYRKKSNFYNELKNNLEKLDNKYLISEIINTPDFIEGKILKNTIQVYVKNMTITIGQFLEFINIHKLKNKYESIQELTLNDIRSLNNSDIYSFIYFLAESQYKINSRVVKTEHLRTFFEYLFTIQHTIFKEPFKKIKADRKIVKKLPNYLSLDEAKKMINVYANSKYGLEIRDNAVIHLFLNSGLRLSELKNLSIDDLDLDNGKFSIIGKGNKERTGYINKMTKKAIEEYLRIRDNFNPKTKTLLVSKYGSKMSSTAIEKIIKKAYKLSGINDENYCVHTLRHTCATLLYRNGTDIRTIQELLGHVQIDTTEIYTHLHDQEVMDAMLDHPLSQYKMANAEAFCA